MAVVQDSLPPPLALRITGPLACFTRPEFKVERVSYPVITPSAARGVLEAVLWKPAMRWRVERIKVLAPIAFTSFRRNEVGAIASKPSAGLISRGGTFEPFFIEEHRQQRNTVALRCVDYVIEARLDLTSKAGPGDNKAKFVEMFRRRLAAGQHFQQPYLGCREFAGNVQPVDASTPSPIDETRDLGEMLLDFTFSTDATRPTFFNAVLARGVIEVPGHFESPSLSRTGSKKGDK